MDFERHSMPSVQVGRTDHQFRVLFNVDATRSEHDELMRRFRQCASIAQIRGQSAPERE